VQQEAQARAAPPSVERQEGMEAAQATEIVNKSEANLVLETHLAELGLSFNTEMCFSAVRRWRFDYVLSGCGFPTAIEIEGAVWTQGRHTRGSGYERDLEKYNTAATLGWRVLRFSTGQVLTGKAKEFLKEWLVLPAESKT
jgi:hypothetical protein